MSLVRPYQVFSLAEVSVGQLGYKSGFLAPLDVCTIK